MAIDRCAYSVPRMLSHAVSGCILFQVVKMVFRSWELEGMRRTGRGAQGRVEVLFESLESLGRGL